MLNGGTRWTQAKMPIQLKNRHINFDMRLTIHDGPDVPGPCVVVGLHMEGMKFGDWISGIEFSLLDADGGKQVPGLRRLDQNALRDINLGRANGVVLVELAHLFDEERRLLDNDKLTVLCEVSIPREVVNRYQYQ